MANTQKPHDVGLPRHPFRSVHQAATELREAATAAGAGPLHLVPFNRYAPADTDWWLSPEPESPVYKYAKIVLSTGESAAPGDLFVGLAYEKGIGPSAAEFFENAARDRRRVADRTWAWGRSLMPALRSGAFAESAVEAEAAAGLPLTVYMASIYMQTSRSWDDDADVRSMNWPVDVVRFECSGGTLTVTDAELSAGLLPEVSRASTFEDIASGLEAMPSADWAWVDFTIGIRLNRATEPKTPDWSAAEMWRRACQPWVGWIG